MCASLQTRARDDSDDDEIALCVYAMSVTKPHTQSTPTTLQIGLCRVYPEPREVFTLHTHTHTIRRCVCALAHVRCRALFERRERRVRVLNRLSSSSPLWVCAGRRRRRRRWARTSGTLQSISVIMLCIYACCVRTGLQYHSTANIEYMGGCHNNRQTETEIVVHLFVHLDRLYWA